MVHIITDTTASITKEFAQQHNVPIIPQIVVFGTESFREGIDIDNAGFIRRLRAARDLPKTAAPPPEWFVEEFRRLAPSGEPILCIHPSAEVSGTVRSATLAKAEFPNADIRVIDTRTIASPLGSMVQVAVQRAEAGKSADEIEAEVRDMIERAHIYFLVATLDYLARGGRIGGAAALLGSVLQVKPILTLRDGRVDQLEKVRTEKRAVATLIDLVLEKAPHDGSGYVSVVHADAPEAARALAATLGIRLGLPNVPILDVPPAITTHAGPGILGASFFVKG